MLLNSLGRVLVASGLVAVTSFMASTAAFAVPLEIIGNVATTATITATADPFSILENLAARQVKVAKVYLGTNNSSGLTVSTGLTDVFTLKNVREEASTPVNFKVGIVAGTSGTPDEFVESSAGATSGVFKTNGPGTAVEHSLYIEYNTAANGPNQRTGDYKATINLSVADK